MRTTSTFIVLATVCLTGCNAEILGGGSTDDKGASVGDPTSGPAASPSGIAGGPASSPGFSAGSGTSGSTMSAPPSGSPGGLGAPPAPSLPIASAPGSNTGDKYSAPGTNPFVMTSLDPFSTFAIDVDTASYDIFRRDVNLGALPVPASVRLEEYVNAFRYAYPAPDAAAEHPFAIDVGAATNVFDRQTMLLRVGIQGRNPPPAEKRPASLVFLVDVSGSMQAADRLPLAQQLMRQTLDVLDPEDTVSIVSYASNTSVRLAPTPISRRASIIAAIDGLTAAGSTAGANGLQLAYDQAQIGFIPGGLNHILLVTDGDFNVGPSSTRELVEIVRQRRKTGVTLTVLGFGVGNLNDDLMEAISNAGNGIYGMISSEEQAARYVRERMLSTLVHIAKDVKIQVELNPTRVLAYRLLGYENRAIADGDFRNDLVDAGEIGAGHQVTALYELVLAGGAIPQPAGALPPLDGTASDLPREVAPAELVRVKVRYKGVDATETTPAREVMAVLAHHEVFESLAAADEDLRFAAAIAAYAEILKQSPFAERSMLPAIEQIVTAQAGRDADRRELADLFAKAKPVVTAR